MVIVYSDQVMSPHHCDLLIQIFMAVKAYNKIIEKAQTASWFCPASIPIYVLHDLIP